MRGSAFAKAAPALVRNGYRPITLMPEEKRPGEYAVSGWRGSMGWNQYKKRPPTQAEVNAWMSWPNAGVGVITGESAGLVALDFDEDNGTHAQIMAMLPKDTVKKRGKRGETWFFRFNGEPTRKWQIDKKVTVLELLSDGRQTVMPPSIHPDTQEPYEYLTKKTLENTRIEDLPVLPDGFVEKMDNLFHPPEPVKLYPGATDYKNSETTWEQVESALDAVPADDYHVWVEIGMALQDWAGDKGYAIWDKWSMSSTKYKSRGMLMKWRSFRNHGITIATLFKHAQDCGWVWFPPQAERTEEKDLVKIAPGGNLECVLTQSVSVTTKPPAGGRKENVRTTSVTDNILNAPGLVGKIKDWIVETAIIPQPHLALAAAITAVGVLMAHRVRTPTNARTNMLALGIGPSGCGKDHPRKCIMELFAAAGLINLVGGNPASGAGLLSSISEAQGRRIIMIDEIGRHLGGLNSKGASKFHMDILTNIMELFSTASSRFVGQEYANRDKKSKRVDIEQPCLCVLGTTVPSRFYDALTSADAIDGFLSRWLVFEVDDPDAEEQDEPPLPVPPDDLVAMIRAIDEWDTRKTLGGNIEQFIPDPPVVTFSEDAKSIFKDFRKSSREQMRIERKVQSDFDAIYARSHEHALKLALLTLDGSPDMGAMVTARGAHWACNVVEYSNRKITQGLARHLSDNEQEAYTKRVLEIITKAGEPGMTRNELTRKTQFLDPRRRGGIITNLVEADKILLEREETTGGRPKEILRAS